MFDEFKFKRSFGQNFLNNESLLTKIVESAGIENNSLVIEIGPGSGNLTKKLSEKAKQVLCYEIDDSLEGVLDTSLKEYHNVDVIFQDFLKSNISEEIKKYNYEHLYLVSNIPYYITTPIIKKIIESKINFDNIVILVQKEVGDRFKALPKTKEYNSLTVCLNYYFEIKKLFVVDRSSFTPKPHVDSVLLEIKPKHDRLKLNDEEFFFNLVKDAFKYKRKNLKNNLKYYNLNIINETLAKHGLDLTVRAEALSLEVFVDIANSLK